MFSWNNNFYVACSASDVKTGVETITGCPRKSPDILVQIRHGIWVCSYPRMSQGTPRHPATVSPGACGDGMQY